MIPTATVYSSTVNLVKTIVGAGLLAIPYAFRADGVTVAIILLLFAAITSGFGLYLLSLSSKALLNPRQSSFFTLCSVTYPKLSFLFDFAMFIQCYGVGLSYLVLVGDLFSSLLGGRRNWWILGSTIIVVPLAHLRQLDSLKYSSLVGLLSITYLVLLVTGTFLQGVMFGNKYVEHRGDVSWLHIHSVGELVSTFSIIILAYTGSMNMFSVINELKDNSTANAKRVVYYSVGISTLIFLSVGLGGYLTFGNNVLTNVILNYDESAITTRIGTFSLGTMVILSFPLLFHPGRIAFNNMVHWLDITYALYIMRREQKLEEPVLADNESTRPICMSVDDEEDRLMLGIEGESYQSLPRGTQSQEELSEQMEHDSSAVPLDGSRFYIVTWILLLIMYVLALNVTSFALILALVGSTGSTSISFTLPGLFGYKLIGTESLIKGNSLNRKEIWCRLASLGLALYGILVTLISVFVIIYFGI
ncbi:Avt7p Ecym_3335 [Eremothecium cymbalariae DBVPG|uniref:Amino acid transporter transmembrane domain-containing protein n=1 Tax=Eremothecium cymbalariae (strain CBS 270.75 / DBVPG 7215 / KCTC 17166 / NRRL Y-17582) TaxID=931890 RepID=G8JRQ6_ERECY|nr:Hypothetical protein Ecym_3335 [Eremothecium cymbalariae DBVPG\